MNDSTAARGPACGNSANSVQDQHLQALAESLLSLSADDRTKTDDAMPAPDREQALQATWYHRNGPWSISRPDWTVEAANKPAAAGQQWAGKPRSRL
jgi:hypothetical protein